MATLASNKLLSGKPYPLETQKGLLVALEPQVLGVNVLKVRISRV